MLFYVFLSGLQSARIVAFLFLYYIDFEGVIGELSNVQGGGLAAGSGRFRACGANRAFGVRARLVRRVCLAGRAGVAPSSVAPPARAPIPPIQPAAPPRPSRPPKSRTAPISPKTAPNTAANSAPLSVGKLNFVGVVSGCRIGFLNCFWICCIFFWKCVIYAANASFFFWFCVICLGF